MFQMQFFDKNTFVLCLFLPTIFALNQCKQQEGFTIEENAENDIGALAVTDITECCKSCSEYSDCKSYVWDSTDLDTKCILKSVSGPLISSSGSIVGFKYVAERKIGFPNSKTSNSNNLQNVSAAAVILAEVLERWRCYFWNQHCKIHGELLWSASKKVIFASTEDMLYHNRERFSTTHYEKCGLQHYTPKRDARDTSVDGLSPKIVNGSEAVPHSWPWQVAIFRKSGDEFVYACGGSLISPIHVLTAAHCQLYSANASNYKVMLGAHDLTNNFEGHAEISAKSFTLADGNNVKRMQFPNDIAVITLENAAPYGETISPVCLPEANTTLPIEKLCYVIGWGSNGTRSMTHLYQGAVFIRNDCQSVYSRDFHNDSMVCAGDNSIDTCGGDSGGPLLCQVSGRWYIYGVTSFGKSTCGRGKPAVYTKVSNYDKWLSHVLIF